MAALGGEIGRTDFMSSTLEKISSNQVKIDFSVEPEIFEKGMESAYRKLVKRINIPGFRKGHAPRKVIELHYGESVFYEDAFDAVFPELYDAAVREHA
jgi:trigger factor